MPLAAKIERILDSRMLRSAFVPIISYLGRSQGQGIEKISCEQGVWLHKTSGGYFAYPHPYLRLDMAKMDAAAKDHFFWGYTPRPGDIVMDVGAGVGEETLTFCRAVGEGGRVICVEAHPRTFRCLETLVERNRLANVTALHLAVTEPFCTAVTIGDSDEYLRNRLDSGRGFVVSATKIDALHEKLGLGRIDFLKLNIEGAERFAIRGMEKTLKHIAILCVSCHDFLAESSADRGLRTKAEVRQFLQERGFRLAARPEAGLMPYLRDQVWAYNDAILAAVAS